MDRTFATPPTLKLLQGSEPQSLTEAERMHLFEEVDVTEAIEFFRRRRRQRSRAANSGLTLVQAQRVEKAP